MPTQPSSTISTQAKLDEVIAKFAKETDKAKKETLRSQAKELAVQITREEIARIEAIIVDPANARRPGKKAAARRQANLLREKVGMPALVSGSGNGGVSDTTPRVTDNVLALLAD